MRIWLKISAVTLTSSFSEFQKSRKINIVNIVERVPKLPNPPLKTVEVKTKNKRVHRNIILDIENLLIIDRELIK